MTISWLTRLRNLLRWARPSPRAAIPPGRRATIADVLELALANRGHRWRSAEWSEGIAGHIETIDGLRVPIAVSGLELLQNGDNPGATISLLCAKIKNAERTLENMRELGTWEPEP